MLFRVISVLFFNQEKKILILGQFSSAEEGEKNRGDEPVHELQLEVFIRVFW